MYAGATGNYRVVPLPDAVSALRRGLSLPRNAVAITFDDGYADNLAAAAALARRGLSATFYVTAGCLADGAPFWPSELRALVGALDKDRIDFDVAGTKITLLTSTPSERRAAISKLNKVFKGHTIPVREAGRRWRARAAGGRGWRRALGLGGGSGQGGGLGPSSTSSLRHLRLTWGGTCSKEQGRHNAVPKAQAPKGSRALAAETGRHSEFRFQHLGTPIGRCGYVDD